MGYRVVGNVASGEEAVPKALALCPELILMDIRLRGEMDGIRASEKIRERLDVPIVYLTAYADDETILRATTTSPFGYVVKPFNERELRAAIEVALYKHETDRALAEERAKRRAAEELKVVNEQLESAVHARDEFLSIASHELRTPLSALVLQLHGIHKGLKESSGELNPRLTQKAEKAVKSANRLTKLIDTLLEVSRIATGKLEPMFETVDLMELARDVTERFGEQVAQAKCTLSVEGPESLTCECDRLRIEQVLVNLLSNAIKYGAGKPIVVSLSTAQELVRLAVRDEGPGISPDDVKRIFTRFERAVSAHNYGGLGLGLYIAREIVEAHGGRIDAFSVPGQGATLAVELPVQPIGVRTRGRGDVD
jgi:signal transduction histidine kinase